MSNPESVGIHVINPRNRFYMVKTDFGKLFCSLSLTFFQLFKVLLKDWSKMELFL